MRVKIQNATNPTNHTQKLGKQKQTKRKKKKKIRGYVIRLFLSVLVYFKVYIYPDVASLVLVSHYTNNIFNLA